MRALLLSAVFVAGSLAAAVAPASAQFGVYVGPDGGGVAVGRPDRGYGPPPPDRGYGPPPDRRYGPPPRRGYNGGYGDWRVSREEAVRIARRNGMAEIYDVERTPRAWVVRGETYRGRRVSMRVDRDGGWSW